MTAALAYIGETRLPATVPDTMRALQINIVSPDLSGVSIVRIATPQPGPDEVLVRIRAASVGFPDLLTARGLYHSKPELPYVGGSDVAGEVVAVGAGVTRFRVGDPVAAMYRGGGFAEFACYPATAVFPKPARLSFAEAAALGSAYLTAYVALVRYGALTPGEWLLVHGASGGVGLAAVDLGRALGARVIAAMSAQNKRSLVASEYGPEAVINGKAGFRETVKSITGGGADVIFDPVGGEVFTESTRCIAFGGRLLVVGFAGGQPAGVATNIALVKGFSVCGVRAGEYGRKFPQRGRENMEAILKLAAEGTIRPRVHAEVPFARWRDAFQMIVDRDVVGRAVLVFGT